MRPPFPEHLLNTLQIRRAEGGFRELCSIDGLVDLCSNDYLGISGRLARELLPLVPTVVGATGSRLVSGNTSAHEELERYLASFHQADSALLFGSGYEANTGLLSVLGGRNDTIIYDELVHASVRDGTKMSLARSYSFRHNDLEDLREKLKVARGDCFIAVESLYSMDGDRAPLKELCDLCDETGAFLVVDEAHATGIFGNHGEGLVQEAGLQERVFARVHTFGKALGYRGACVMGSQTLRDALVNLARPFIYSTAPDLLALALIRMAYEVACAADIERARLFRLIAEFDQVRSSHPELNFLNSSSPIQGVLIPGNEAVVRAETELRESGFAVRAIRSPTVPMGSERIRICLHSFNSIEQLREAISLLADEHGIKRVHGA